MRLVLGEFADALLTGQRVIPQEVAGRGVQVQFSHH